jgi:predicted metal-dependent hydrolase
VSTESHQITVNDLVIDVVRKDIKNLHLAVYPPDGRVRVAAPLLVNDEAVRLYAISKLAWIRRQQAKFERQERQSAREYVSGESHYYRGRRYLLNVVYHDGPPQVVLPSNTRIDLFVRTGSDAAKRERVLLDWYRKQLKEAVPPLIAQWEPVVGVEAWSTSSFTRWCTCWSAITRTGSWPT